MAMSQCGCSTQTLQMKMVTIFSIIWQSTALNFVGKGRCVNLDKQRMREREKEQIFYLLSTGLGQ